ncbi:TadE family protein [Krasilnikovia sp. MM14-A1259]|uniref:TadE family protein n=1 Tax=Krasilnikovia sp. MM14-A1259 TaxID=3373539 RepID=UPI00399D4E4B
MPSSRQLETPSAGRVRPPDTTGVRAPRGWARVRARMSGDRGSVTAEMVVAWPLLLLVFALGVQVGMWALGQLGAQHAANHALQTTRVLDGTATAGRGDATTILQQLAGAFIDDPTVTVTRSADTATVTIRGHAPALFGVRIPIQTTVSAPTERFRPQTLAVAPFGALR